MLAKLKGVVDDIVSEDSLIIDVGGVGYQVYVTSKLLASLKQGDRLEVRVLPVPKQEQQFLFGFQSSDELNLFKNLLKVHGIGGRSALSILSLLSPEEVAMAVATQDPDVLLGVPGIGIKTASRILLELKDLVTKSIGYEMGQAGVVRDAILGLVSLGYPRGEVLRVVNRITSSSSLGSSPPSSANEIIVASLRELK